MTDEEIRAITPYSSVDALSIAHLRDEALARGERERAAQRELDDWINTVPLEKSRLALHYDGCPFKPYADMSDHDPASPETPPACTCGERHKGAYWKARWLLDVGDRDIKLRTARALLEELTRRGLPDNDLFIRVRAFLAPEPGPAR